MSDINLPEYDDEAMNEIWFDDHEDFEAVGPTELEDPTRWGYTASKTVKHLASGTYWLLTASVSCGDDGQTDVDDDLTRVYPRDVTVTKYLPDDTE